MPPVHFAVGMGVSSVLGALLVAVRRRWLIYLPLIMSVCGLLALMPDIVARAGGHVSWLDAGTYRHRAYSHGAAMNVFFFHPWLDRVPWLETQEMTNLGFHLVALMYLVAMCGYVAYIRWGVPRMAEAAEALRRMGRSVSGYRSVAALAGVVPLVLAGAAVGWMVHAARPAQLTARQVLRREEQRWRGLVRRRMRLIPGRYLGLVGGQRRPKGVWLSGDLGAHTTFGGGAASLSTLVERALANRCDFVVIADGAALDSPDRLAAYAKALRAARRRFRDIAVLSGLQWNAPPAGGRRRACVLVAPQVVECGLLAGFYQRFDRLAPNWTGAPAEAALRWLKARNRSYVTVPAVLSSPQASARGRRGELFSWLRTNEVFLGILGQVGSERVSAREARSRWDPRVARVGGAWDQLLDRGFRVWCAAAASGFRDPKTHYWPGEFARTHVWCRSRRAADVLAGLRAGCFWAQEGGIVRALDFELSAPALERPARMGEVVRVAPGEAVSVELELDVPATDFAGRANRIDEVELISNFAGDPKVVQRFRRVKSHSRLGFAFESAEDNNGGLGFYVRARGWRRLEGGSVLYFYTNPIRVLVREGPRRPGAKERVAVRRVVARPAPRQPESKGEAPAKATPKKPVKPAEPVVRKRLQAVGLPSGVRPLHIERFEKKPGRNWRGVWPADVPKRGRALGDEKLKIEFLQTTPLGEATRLFFRCYAEDCRRLTLLLRTSEGLKPYRAVRELTDRQCTEFDLSLRDDFHPPAGAPGHLCSPARIEAIEWRADKLEPQAGFRVTDFVIYEPTAASRLELARDRADELAAKLREAARAGPTPAWRARAQAVGTRLDACKARLASRVAAGEPGVVDRDLDEVAEEQRRLRMHAAMARVFGRDDPRFVVGVEGPTRRVSARNPAASFEGEISRTVELWAAAGETESFQVVVLSLWEPLRAVDVTWSELRPEGRRKGPRLPRSAISANVVSELWVYPRADVPPERAGWMPDPLLPLSPFDVEPGSLRAVLVSARVPLDLPPGDYQGTLSVRPLGLEPVQLTLRLHRWDFALVDSHFAVIGPIDRRAILEHYHDEKSIPEAGRRELYELLLRHRVNPVPLLGKGEAEDLADITFCIERGLGLAVLHQASSARAGPRDAGFARAARYATRIWEAGWGRRGALLLPMVRDRERGEGYVRWVNTLNRRHPALLLFAGGEGAPPPGLVASYWRRPLGVEPPREPKADDLEVRRSRSARREAWEVTRGTPDYPHPNLTLASRLVETRFVPWLAWRHGVRALVLAGVNRWRDNNAGNGLLVYPGPGGDFYPSLRLVALRDAVEDYEYVWLLWDRARRLRERARERNLQNVEGAHLLLDQVRYETGSFRRPCRDPQKLAGLRLRLGRKVEMLEAAWWAEVDAAADLPSPPAELAARAGDGQVSLTWSKAPDEKVSQYNVYRSRDPNVGFFRVNSRSVEALSYVDRSVRNDVRYYYFVRSTRGRGVEGPRSAGIEAAPRPAPKIVWLPMADLRRATVGPYRVLLRLEGPQTGQVLPLVRPQIDYCITDGFYDGFERMTRRADGAWVFEVPDLGWRRHGSKKLRIKVRVVDRRGRVVTPAVEREELIDSAVVPRR